MDMARLLVVCCEDLFYGISILELQAKLYGLLSLIWLLVL